MSRIHAVLAASLHTLLLSVAPCVAATQEGREVAVAAFDLPAGCDGLLHWSDGEVATTPIQLSKRYFSEPVKLAGEVIRF